MKNGSNAVTKRSKIAKSMNNYILVTMLFQFMLSVFAACLSSIFTEYAREDCWYIYPSTVEIT